MGWRVGARIGVGELGGVFDRGWRVDEGFLGGGRKEFVYLEKSGSQRGGLNGVRGMLKRAVWAEYMIGDSDIFRISLLRVSADMQLSWWITTSPRPASYRFPT